MVAWRLWCWRLTATTAARQRVVASADMTGGGRAANLSGSSWGRAGRAAYLSRWERTKREDDWVLSG